MELTLIDNGNSVLASVCGCVQGATWGPAVDNGEWFVKVAGDSEAYRVPDKEAGIKALRDLIGAEKAGS